MTATQPLTETTVLANDVKMPTIGFGTWQIPINENFDSTIQTAIQLGYRQFDTAQIYNNAQRMGEAIRASDVPRSEFFLTSKIWASHRSYESAREAYEMILTQMQTDYLDLLLIHWPAAQGEPMVWQAQNAGAWRALEELYTEGRVRAIGVSNFQPEHLRRIVGAAACPCPRKTDGESARNSSGLCAAGRRQFLPCQGHSGSGLESARPRDAPAPCAARKDRCRPRQDACPGRSAVVH